MLERDLVLRDILKFGQIIEEKMRAESSREGEIGREALIQIMRIKLMEEMRFYRESKRIRETIRDYIRRKFGRRRYNSIIEKIKQAMEKRKTELEEKYKNKIEHLAALREQEKRDKLEIIPAGLERYANCKIFSREKMKEMRPQHITHKLIGDIKIDENEKKVLDLNPKFAVMKKLVNIEMEQDIELGMAKLRYEEVEL